MAGVLRDACCGGTVKGVAPLCALLPPYLEGWARGPCKPLPAELPTELPAELPKKLPKELPDVLPLPGKHTLPKQVPKPDAVLPDMQSVLELHAPNCHRVLTNPSAGSVRTPAVAAGPATSMTNPATPI